MPVQSPVTVGSEVSPYYSATNQVPKPRESAAFVPHRTKQALKNVFKTLSLNLRAAYGVNHHSTNARAREGLQAINDAVERMLKTPLPNSTSTAEMGALRSALAEIRERYNYVKDASYQTQAVHYTGSGLTRLPSINELLNRVFEMTGMGRIPSYRTLSSN